MEIVIKASAVALITAVGALLIKKSNPEYSFLLGVIGAAIILSSAAVMLSTLKETFDEIIEKSGLSMAIFSPLIKCTVIAVTVKIVSSMSRDSGQSGIASSVEFIGAAAALYTSLPLLNSVARAALRVPRE